MLPVELAQTEPAPVTEHTGTALTVCVSDSETLVLKLVLPL